MQLPPAALLVTHQGNQISMFQDFLPSSICPILAVLSDRGQTPGVHAQHSELQGRNFKTNSGMLMFIKVFFPIYLIW